MMGSLRALLQDRVVVAGLVVALALFLRVLVPPGYMLASGADGPALTLCPQGFPGTAAKSSHHPAAHAATGHDAASEDGRDHPAHDQTSRPCPYAVLTLAPLAAADPVLLATAVAFVLAAGFAARPAVIVRDRAFLRPPLRGPPARA